MKPGIHPAYKKSHVVCACGNVFETRSTRGDFHVDICSNCHPFFTGKQKLIDTEGRVDRFKRKYAKTAEAAAKAAAKQAAPAAAAEATKKTKKAEKKAAEPKAE